MMNRRGFLRTSAAAAALSALGELRAGTASRLEAAPAARAVADPFRSLADEYLLDPEVLYLNHGSIGTIPRLVHEARLGYLALCETNPHLHIWGEPWVEPVDAVHAGLARMAGCAPHEVAVTHNTTEGFNFLAAGLTLDPGDEVLFSSLNHGGASRCWEHQAAVRGFTVRRFEFPLAEVPGLTADDVVELHLREIGDRTRVLVFPHVDNVVGLRHPVASLARAARARGVEFVAVDGAQYLGMLPLDLATAGVDFYAASPHKWLQAPKGLGFLYLREGVQDRVRPQQVTWGQAQWAGTARIFADYGTRNLPEVLTLGDAVAFQAGIGPAAREARHRAHWARLRAAVEAAPGLAWRSPERWENAGALILVGTPRHDDPFALADRLWRERGAVFRPFRTDEGAAVRLSPNLQTTADELDEIVALLAG
jgi:isopenicillin-N epimerase